MSDEDLEELTDLAYEALTDELEHWRIIGPDAKGVFIAVRDPQIEMKMKAAAIIAPQASVNDVEGKDSARKMFRMMDKEHAVACLQWHALRAALAAVKRELAPSASDAAVTITSDAQLSTAANEEDEDK